MQQFDQSELNMMSDDEAVQMGQLVNKVDKHVAGCLTIGYAAMIFAQLIRGTVYEEQVSMRNLKKKISR